MKAVIFDFDGVIHNTFENLYGIYSSINENSSREEYRRLFEGNVFDNLAESDEENKRFKDGMNLLYPKLIIDENIKNYLLNLKNNHRLFIISSCTEGNLHIYFRNNDLPDLFEDILAEETHKSKVEKFKILFERHNLVRDDCVFITDTLGDIREANKVGVKTIAVDFGFHSREKLLEGSPYKIISKFDEISEHI